MFIDDLTDRERGLIMVALKYWRANRRATATRRTDPEMAPDAVDLLLLKLGAADLPSLPPADEDLSDLFHH